MSVTAEAPGDGWPNVLAPHNRGLLVEDAWPTLFFGPERLSEIRRKVSSLGWAASALARIRDDAELVLPEAPTLPQESVGWRHDFYSRRTGEHLVFDSARPRNHIDPSDQSIHDAEEQHSAWVLLAHERTYRVMRSLGLLYGLTAERRYAEWVADGMRRAVAMFSREDLRRSQRHGSLYFQPLYDAQVLLLLADAYALTRECPVYTDEDHFAIRTCIFESGMASLLSFLRSAGTHNMTCYASAAAFAAGRLLGRTEWCTLALEHPRTGLGALLAQGVPSDAQGNVDGLWLERSMFYHLYSLFPLIVLHEGERARSSGKAEHHGPGLPRAEVSRRLAAMFAAPVHLADAELRLPPLGDLGAPGVLNLRSYRHLYEYAAGRIDPTYGKILARIYGRGVPRTGWAALAFGPDDLSEPPLYSTQSALLPVAGIAVVRGQTALGPIEVSVQGGVSRTGGGGHEHRDRMSLTLQAAGEMILADPGTPGYAVRDLCAFCRSTFAHHTLMVDERDQEPARDVQTSLSGDTAVVRFVGAAAGVTLTRRIRLHVPYLKIEDGCEAAEAHIFSWVVHPLGSLSCDVGALSAGSPLPPLPTEGAFAHFRVGWTAWGAGPFCADWRVSDRLWLRIWVTADRDFEVTAGTTPANPATRGRGTLLIRTRATACRFRSAFEVHQGTPTLIRSPW